MLDQFFTWRGNLIFLGWGALLLSPVAPIWADRLAGHAVPALLSAGYTALTLVHWSDARGGFGSLPEVAALLSHPPMLLAGWVHFLAIDLFVGAWIVRTARTKGIAFVWVMPCLPITLMFGPAGCLLSTALRAACAATRVAAQTRAEA